MLMCSRLVSCLPSSFAFGVVQVRASQGRREREPGRMSTEENAARCVHGRRQTLRDLGDATLESGQSSTVHLGHMASAKGESECCVAPCFDYPAVTRSRTW